MESSGNCHYTAQGAIVCNGRYKTVIDPHTKAEPLRLTAEDDYMIPASGWEDKVKGNRSHVEQFSQPAWVPPTVPRPSIWTARPTNEWEAKAKEINEYIQQLDRKELKDY